MKVFISWSEAKSRAMAAALAEALPVIINAVEPFFSQEIEKGTAGDHEIHTALEGTGFGIICLTSDNLASPWMHYEAGALAKSGERVWTLLLDVKHSDVKPPLSRFQHTMATKSDFFRLVESINANLPLAGHKALPDATLHTAFDLNWPRLEAAFCAAESHGQGRLVKGHRSDRELLEEILDVVRAQAPAKLIDMLSDQLGSDRWPVFWPYVIKVTDVGLVEDTISALKLVGAVASEDVGGGDVICVFPNRLEDPTVSLLLKQLPISRIQSARVASSLGRAIKRGLDALAEQNQPSLLELIDKLSGAGDNDE